MANVQTALILETTIATVQLVTVERMMHARRLMRQEDK